MCLGIAILGIPRYVHTMRVCFENQSILEGHVEDTSLSGRHSVCMNEYVCVCVDAAPVQEGYIDLWPERLVQPSHICCSILAQGAGLLNASDL